MAETAGTWYDALSEKALEQMQTLWDKGLDVFAELRQKNDAVIPGALTIGADMTLDSVELDAETVDLEEEDAGAKLVDRLREQLIAARDSFDAVAIIIDSQNASSEFVKLLMEHREGTAIVVEIPYRVTRFRKRIELAAPEMNLLEPFVWAD